MKTAGVLGNSGSDMMCKVIRSLRNSWSEIFEGSAPPSAESFSFRSLRGNGATSKRFLLQVTDSEKTNRNFFVKRYGMAGEDKNNWTEQLIRDYKVTRRIASFLAECKSLRVPATYLIVPEEKALVMDYIAGDNLSSYFYRRVRFSGLTPGGSNQDLENLVSRIGSGLAAIQALPYDLLKEVLVPPSLGAAFSTCLGQFEEAAGFLERQGLSSNLVRQGRSILEKVLSDYFSSGPDWCLEHRDFGLQNIIMHSSGALYLFDFPNATIGTRYRDAAQFVGALQDLTYARTVSRKRIESLATHFLNALTAGRHFDSRVFTAFQILVQFRSTMFLLSTNRLQKWGLLRPFLFQDPRKRFKETVTFLFTQYN